MPVPLTTVNPTWTGLGSDICLHGWRPPNDWMCYGRPRTFMIMGLAKYLATHFHKSSLLQLLMQQYVALYSMHFINYFWKCSCWGCWKRGNSHYGRCVMCQAILRIIKQFDVSTSCMSARKVIYTVSHNKFIGLLINIFKHTILYYWKY